MGAIGKCCCGDECDCLIEDDLPVLTLGGFTGGGWVADEGNACCWRQVFTPDETPTETQYVTDMLCEASKHEMHEFKTWWVKQPKLLFLTESDPIPTVITDPDFCCKRLLEAAESTHEFLRTIRTRLVLDVTPGDITIIMSREKFSCIGAECKLVFTMEREFTWGIAEQRVWQIVETITDTVLDACFELDVGGTTNTTVNTTGSLTWPSTIGLTPDWTGSGTIRKHKWYDTMPVELDFTTADVPLSECPGDACHQMDQLNEEICFSIGDLPDGYSCGYRSDFPLELDFCDDGDSTDLIDGGVYHGGYETTIVNSDCDGVNVQTLVAIYEEPCDPETPSLVLTNVPVEVDCTYVEMLTLIFNIGITQVELIDDSCCDVYTLPCEQPDLVVCPEFYHVEPISYSRVITCDLYPEVLSDICIQSTPIFTVE